MKSAPPPPLAYVEIISNDPIATTCIYLCWGYFFHFVLLNHRISKAIQRTIFFKYFTTTDAICIFSHFRANLNWVES